MFLSDSYFHEYGSGRRHFTSTESKRGPVAVHQHNAAVAKRVIVPSDSWPRAFRAAAGGNAGSHRTEVQLVGIIAFLILGVLAGMIAKAIMPGDDPGGIFVTMLIGVVGALLGGFLASALFGAHPVDEFFDISTWLTAIVGAVLLLWIYRMVVGSRGRRGHLA